MITQSDFIEAINEYTSIYNDKTWDQHLKREYPSSALDVLYQVYCEHVQRGFFTNGDRADYVAACMVDTWAFIKPSKLTEMCKDGFASNNERYSVADMKSELNENNALFSCKGGFVLNLEVFEEYFPHYYAYTGESLTTQNDYHDYDRTNI